MSSFVGAVRALSQVVFAAMAWFGLAMFVSCIGSKIDRVRRNQWKLFLVVIGCCVISVVSAKNIGDGIYNLVLFPFLLIKMAVTGN